MRPRLLPAFRSLDARILVRAVAALVFVSALFSAAAPAPAAAGLPAGVHCLGSDGEAGGPALPADHGCNWCVTSPGLSAPPPPAAASRILAPYQAAVTPSPSGAGPGPSPIDAERQPRAPPLPA